MTDVRVCVCVCVSNLHQNQLSGTIPLSLASATQLAVASVFMATCADCWVAFYLFDPSSVHNYDDDDDDDDDAVTSTE